MRPLLSHRGFTLVEVLVALMIMAMMAGMAWQGVDGIVRARSTSQERLERTLRLNTVMAQWETDLAAIHDARVVPALRVQGTSVLLTREHAAGVQVVVWSLRGNALWRWAGPSATTAEALQESWFASQQLIGTEPGQLRMLDAASDWQLYFFRQNAWSNAQSSGDTARPTGDTNAPIERLPQGVRLVLDLLEGSQALQLTRDIALSPQRP